MGSADLHFYFDPVCPFAWMTSKWVRLVVARRDYTVDWRFISLRMVNAAVDYRTHFPPEYEAGHAAGLKLLRVAAATRAGHGRGAVDSLQAAFGAQLFDAEPLAPGGIADLDTSGLRSVTESMLVSAGLPTSLAAALEDDGYDLDIRVETDEALALTGKDVGTPIIHFDPPEGVAFFGPVISRLPSDEDAIRLWDHVVGLARFSGFSELKRSLREPPQLRSFGLSEGEVGRQEDWHGGSRRTKK